VPRERVLGRAARRTFAADELGWLAMTPAILLMGPTASGKSSVALELAALLPVELVSVDSAQVYRGMDIGTAKPDQATRARVAHHLVDLIEPDEAYSAARFRADALDAMAAIRSRGRIPLLVGGTMLYVKALREGLSRLPAGGPPCTPSSHVSTPRPRRVSRPPTASAFNARLRYFWFPGRHCRRCRAHARPAMRRSFWRSR